MRTLIFFLAASAARPCLSVSQALTFEKEFELAGLVISGVVKSIEQVSLIERKVVLERVDYFKGCGPDLALKVSGFNGGSTCSVEPPRVGAKVIVFGCVSSSDGVTLHSPVPFSGLRLFTDETFSLLVRLKKEASGSCPSLSGASCEKLASPSLTGSQALEVPPIFGK